MKFENGDQVRHESNATGRVKTVGCTPGVLWLEIDAGASGILRVKASECTKVDAPKFKPGDRVCLTGTVSDCQMADGKSFRVLIDRDGVAAPANDGSRAPCFSAEELKKL